MYIHLSWFIYLLKKLSTYDSWELTVHLPPSWAKGEVNLFGRFTKKTFPTPRKEKHEKHRHIQRKHRFVGGFQPLTRVFFGGSQDRSGWRFSSWSRTSGQRCSEGYSRERPETNHTDVGKAWVWGLFLGLCWGFLGYLDLGGGFLL